MSSYDAVLLISFGGPEKPEDVMPFLEIVTRGRNIPPQRLQEVAEHYYHFGGKSPINDQNRALVTALQAELAAHGPQLPVYWGNRNWHPFLVNTLREMKADGVRRALGFVTSAFSSYSGCRQYKENIAKAQAEAGEGAPEIDKVRVFFDHPGFLDANADHLRQAIATVPSPAYVLFTAHSIPLSMSQGSHYTAQLEFTSHALAKAVGIADYQLVYQSRSGPPTVPWLEPDVLDSIRILHTKGVKSIVLAPIGFVSDHMEVVYDLDTEAKDLCAELGISMARALTVGTHPRFIQMIRQLIVERIEGGGIRPGLCTPDCCPPPQRPGRPS